MPFISRSTDAAPPAERFAFWHDAVCRSVLSVSVLPDGALDDFAGRIAARRAGAASFASFRSTPHLIERSARQVAALDNDGFLLSVQLAGEAWMAQGDRRIRLAPGELGIVDGARPFSIRFPRSVERIVAVIPRDLLAERAPALACSGASKLALEPALGALLRDTVRTLAAPELPLDDASTLRLCENVCNLLATASIGAAPEASAFAQRDLARRRAAILTLIRARCSEPDFGPTLAAQTLGLSVRSLHKAFEGTGRSFGAWLLDARLDASRAALEHSQDKRSIAAIALDCGFADVSHFNHAFRRRFGVAPGVVRRGVSAGRT